MEQLTQKQAIAMYESKVWETWTDEEIVRFQLFQRRLCVDFRKFHEAVNKVFDRPVFTHEFASSNVNNLYEEYLGTREAPTFEEIINLIPADKRIVVTR